MQGIAGFEWDAGNREKCTKHGVPLHEIERLFDGEPALAVDTTHSGREPRVRAVGRTRDGRHVFVVFTIRTRLGKQLIRAISARYMHRKEIQRYEKSR